MKAFLEKTYNWCKRYFSYTFVAILFFVIYILFFNENSVVQSYRYTQRIKQLEAEIKECGDTIAYYRQLEERLVADPEVMEAVAREKFRMQGYNEDVYVFENED